jgi:hypothetical protein
MSRPNLVLRSCGNRMPRRILISSSTDITRAELVFLVELAIQKRTLLIEEGAKLIIDRDY